MRKSLANGAIYIQSAPAKLSCYTNIIHHAVKVDILCDLIYKTRYNCIFNISRNTTLKYSSHCIVL